MKITTKQLAQTALLLTISIISQYFKNVSPYITGPIVNATIILATLAVGLHGSLLIGITAPITAFFFTGSPIMTAIPLMFPVIMAGNAILAFTVWYFQNKLSFRSRLPLGLCVASLLKSAFLGIVVALILLPLLGDNIARHLPKPEALPGVIATAKITFSLTQLVTSLAGSFLAFLIWLPLKKYLKTEV